MHALVPGVAPAAEQLQRAFRCLQRICRAAGGQVQLGQHHLRLAHPGVVAHRLLQQLRCHIHIDQRVLLADDRPVERGGGGIVSGGKRLRAAGKHRRQRQLLRQHRVLLQRAPERGNLVQHATTGAHRPGPERSGPVHCLRPLGLHLRKARINVVLPAEPLLHGVGHADHNESSHLKGFQHDLALVCSVVLQHQRAIGLHCPVQHALH